MTLPNSSRIDILKNSLLFSSLSEDELAELSKLAVERNFRPDEFVFWEGDAPEYFYTVTEGRIKIAKYSSSGKEFIVGYRWVSSYSSSGTIAPLWLAGLAIQAVDVAIIGSYEYQALPDHGRGTDQAIRLMLPYEAAVFGADCIQSTIVGTHIDQTLHYQGRRLNRIFCREGPNRFARICIQSMQLPIS